MKDVTDVHRLPESRSKELDPKNPYFFSIVSAPLEKRWEVGCDGPRDLNEWINILRSTMAIQEKIDAPQTGTSSPSSMHQLLPNDADEAVENMGDEQKENVPQKRDRTADTNTDKGPISAIFDDEKYDGDDVMIDHGNVVDTKGGGKEADSSIYARLMAMGFDHEHSSMTLSTHHIKIDCICYH